MRAHAPKLICSTGVSDFQTFKLVFCIYNKLRLHVAILRGNGTLKYGDVHEKFIFLETQDLKPLRTCQKHFETILPNFPPDECKI